MMFALALDLTVNLGNILTIAAMIGGLFVLYLKVVERIVRLETMLTPLWTEFERRRRAR